MGYDLHITRRRDWSSEGDVITTDEWLAYVRSDPELRLNPANGPYFAEWRGPSVTGESWFDWSNGQIEAKNPDPALIDKMVAIASRLNATVQGDDGETYKSGHAAPKKFTPTLGERLIPISFQDER